MIKYIYISILCVSVLACATRPDPAPIENMTNIPNYVQPVSTPTTITANSKAVTTPSPVPTIQMAALENKPVESPSVTRITPPVTKQVAVANAVPAVAVAATTATAAVGNSGWVMPTTGKTDSFVKGSKGIDIYGTQGQTINAVNDGKVVYSGNGLKGYGNLIIIKHANSYLSAYAHNKVNLVKEGVNIKRGQKIAEMGTDDSGKSVLHLEIRKNGKPIDPFSVIKAQ